MIHWRKLAQFERVLTGAVKGAVGDGAGVTLQLSGGLDSAVVQAIARLPVVYCCTWPEMDNLEAASKVACRAQVRPVTFRRDEMLSVALPEVARITRGRGTWTQCCQWFMARAMAADGFRIVMNGEGSDELFGGYARYRFLWWIEQALQDPHLAEYQGFARDLGIDRLTVCNRMLARYGSAVTEVESERMTQRMGAHDEGRPLHELIEFEHDVAAAHGVEHRWPYMHDEVVRFAHSLTEEDKITARESKHILRELARGLGVHPDCTDEVTKRGLVVPPSWAPAGSRKWSRDWFTAEMDAAWQRIAPRSGDTDGDNILCGAPL
jgi:asparagine synthetase B (glutamine-hydrolysing)